MARLLSEMVKERPLRRAACGATPEGLRRIEVGERRRRIESGCTPESASRSAPGCTAACTPAHTTASQQPWLGLGLGLGLGFGLGLGLGLDP